MADFSFCRLILYVQDVPKLSSFYQKHFGLEVIESIPGEWAVLRSGSFELALHLAGPGYRDQAPHGCGSNAKLVFETKEDLELLRERFAGTGVKLGAVKAYKGFDYKLLDGTDPEGNVFQFMQKTK